MGMIAGKPFRALAAVPVHALRAPVPAALPGHETTLPQNPFPRAGKDSPRDPRRHTISTVFLAEADGNPRGGDDAATARICSPENLPPLVFDHAQIIADYLAERY